MHIMKYEPIVIVTAKHGNDMIVLLNNLHKIRNIYNATFETVILLRTFKISSLFHINAFETVAPTKTGKWEKIITISLFILENATVSFNH